MKFTHARIASTAYAIKVYYTHKNMFVTASDYKGLDHYH